MTARLLVVEHEPDITLDRLAAPLAASGLDVTVVGPHGVPATPAGHDGLLVLGGRMAAWEDDDAPWLPAVRSLLREAVRDDVPTLGLCLGAQLLALATGGQVERGPAGAEVGVVEVTVVDATAGAAAADPFTSRLGPVVVAPQSHRDAVTRLPPGAVLLASSAQYPHQAFRVGARAWGLQYHPEVSAPVFAGWVREHAADLAGQGRTVDDVLAHAAAAEPALAASARRHAEAFAAVVRAGRSVGAAGS